MKKNTLIVLLFSTFSFLFAQVPQKMSYQAVIRKPDGTLVANTPVGIKISILKDNENGTAVYEETHTSTTNINGLTSLAIGAGKPMKGTFSTIDWSTGNYFIKTETDISGGSSYTISGTSQLLSVPYALYAGNSQNKGKTSIMITGNITDTQAAKQIATELGPFTENIYITNTTGLTTLDLGKITDLAEIRITNNKDLKNINLSYLSNIYGVCVIQTNPSLSSIDLTSLTSIQSDFNLRYNSLTSTFINTFLNRLLTVIPSTDKYVLLNGQNPPAPPTGQGILDYETLIKTGNGIYTD